MDKGTTGRADRSARSPPSGSIEAAPEGVSHSTAAPTQPHPSAEATAFAAEVGSQSRILAGSLSRGLAGLPLPGTRYWWVSLADSVFPGLRPGSGLK